MSDLGNARRTLKVYFRRGDPRGAVKHVVPVPGLVVPRCVNHVGAELERVDVDVERVFVVPR